MSEPTSQEESELASWGDRLKALDAELAQREAAAAAAGNWSPAELAALAKEHDVLADQWDELADARDAAAVERDTSAEAREATATQRDRRARAHALDTDEGFADRFLSARDRDDAAGTGASRGPSAGTAPPTAPARVPTAPERQQTGSGPTSGGRYTTRRSPGFALRSSPGTRSGSPKAS